MSKRKNGAMGEGAAALFEAKATPAQVVAVAAGDTRRTAPKPVAVVPPPVEEERVRYAVANMRLRQDQLHDIHAEAVRRWQKRGSGKPDQSEVFRDIVDEWQKKHRGGG